MEAQGVQRGSTNAIGEIIRRGTRISMQDMTTIAAKAEAAGGSLVAVDPDGDWCGTGHIHIKYPLPKKQEFFNLLEFLVDQYINHEILINGIPKPEYLVINVSRQFGRKNFGF